MKLQDKDTLLQLLNHFNIDGVVHFAAQSHVDNSFTDSFVFTDDNVIATHILVECCRLYDNQQGKLKKFIHISTDEVYGDSTLKDHNEIKTENSPLNPCNPYSGTKAAAEMIVRSYIQTYRMPVVIVRPNNVYGRNQYPEKLIPKFINQLRNGQQCTIHGDGRYLRSFLHTYDLNAALEILLQYGVLSEAYNVGSTDEYSVLDIARILVKKIIGTDEYEKYITFVPDRIFNDIRYLISCDKIKSLGWKQMVSFEDGINDTIGSYVT
jgi:dTDP-glucose 4,6-dehydratase/UDP-glucose 4,6-dehydratase